MPIILLLILTSAHAARITVGTEDEDFQHIQPAIDNSSRGDIIEIHSGIYRERINVSKAVTLLGIDTGEGTPVINASGSGSALVLMANGTTIKGLNLTGSGQCGCGSSGILVQSSNNTILNNVAYGNYYGIYVRPGYTNNTFIANDLIYNRVAAKDEGENLWNGILQAEGQQSLAESAVENQMRGNHYSDFDEPKEGCKDLNNDGLCDRRKKIDGGRSIDSCASIAVQNL